MTKQERERLRELLAGIHLPITVGRIPRDEEPDTCILGSRCVFWGRVVGSPSDPAEQKAFLLAIGANSLPDLLSDSEERDALRVRLEQCVAALRVARPCLANCRHFAVCQIGKCDDKYIIRCECGLTAALAAIDAALEAK